MTSPSLVLEAVARELARGQSNYPAFHSQHEGAAVIKEEYDELWDAIKASKSLDARGTTAIEAMQVAAMAVRFIVDLCDEAEFAATLSGFERTR